MIACVLHGCLHQTKPVLFTGDLQIRDCLHTEGTAPISLGTQQKKKWEKWGTESWSGYDTRQESEDKGEQT